MPADDGVGLDDGKVPSPIGEKTGENGPKCPVRRPELGTLGVSLQNLELMAEGDVLKEELAAGSEDGGSRVQDDFKHPFMLYSDLRNRNDTKADGIFGRHRCRS